jgi:urease subunit gamma/beta
VLLGDGTRLVTLVDPLGRGAAPTADGPGAVMPVPEDLRAKRGDEARDRREIAVTNTSRRVVRVSSHAPFHRVNRRLEFDRTRATGFRLDIEAGSSERWGPGETRTVALVAFGGRGGDA